MIYRLYR